MPECRSRRTSAPKRSSTPTLRRKCEQTYVAHLHLVDARLLVATRPPIGRGVSPPSILPVLDPSKATNSPQADDEAVRQAKSKVDALLSDIHAKSQEAASSGLLDREKYVIPPHLHDLQEADLPETQRGLVMTEIAQFRERAAKREREKMRDVREAMPNVLAIPAPSGPKPREWGRPQHTPEPPSASKGFGKGPQGYNKPPAFVRSDDGSRTPSERQSSLRPGKTDEELENERKEARRRDEENSYKDVSAPFVPS